MQHVNSLLINTISLYLPTMLLPWVKDTMETIFGNPNVCRTNKFQRYFHQSEPQAIKLCHIDNF